jgi:hypothetical protein
MKQFEDHETTLCPVGRKKADAPELCVGCPSSDFFALVSALLFREKSEAKINVACFHFL